MEDERLAKIEQERQNAINNSNNTYITPIITPNIIKYLFGNIFKLIKYTKKTIVNIIEIIDKKIHIFLVCFLLFFIIHLPLLLTYIIIAHYCL